MSMSSLADAKAGLVRPSIYVKTQGQSPVGASSALRAISPWYVAGTPNNAAANAVGVDGAAVTGPNANAILRSNAPGGAAAYLAHMSARASRCGTILLIDRLWHNSGLSVTSTSSQAITAAALPARCIGGNSNGDGVFAAIEWSGAGGAGTPTVTLNYDDQGGNPGSGTFTATASPVAGQMEIFSLDGGDTGIRAPTSFQQSATRNSGTMHLVLFRILASIPLPHDNMPAAIDAITGSFARIYDDAVLYPILLNSTTAGNTMMVQLQETVG